MNRVDGRVAIVTGAAGGIGSATARLLAQGHAVLYYENIEGGHGGAADATQRAHLSALEFSYLWLQLGQVARATRLLDHDAPESPPWLLADRQLLRLVYRLIFLLTIEERGLLHPDGTPDAARTLYADGYSLRRLRERSAKRSAHDRHSDLWQATQIVFRGVAGGELRLGLPALAGIFAKSQCPALDAAKLENRALLFAVFKLSWLQDAAGLARVNWRDMGPEELGSVYESLLELVPEVDVHGRQFGFVGLTSEGSTAGNDRKTSGSYYTPDSLVQVLLDSALEPVIADTIAKKFQKAKKLQFFYTVQHWTDIK